MPQFAWVIRHGRNYAQIKDGAVRMTIDHRQATRFPDERTASRHMIDGGRVEQHMWL